MGKRYETRRVTLGDGADIKRGEAVEIKTAGDGTALDEVQALTDATKLEGFALHTYLNEAGETCEADIIWESDGLAREAVTFPAGDVKDLVDVRDRLPLLDNTNTQGVL